MGPKFLGSFEPIEVSDPELERDGVRYLTFHSKSLLGRGDVSVFIPKGTRFPTEIPLVVMLHGVYGSHWSWFLKGAAHRVAQQLIDTRQIRPMMLAAPSDGLSGDGSGYWKLPSRDVEAWIVDDVPSCIRTIFASNGPTFLCGLSMGGYAALRLGFKYPLRYQAISAHSPITQAEQLRDFVREGSLPVPDLADPELDILRWARAHSKELPAVRMDCGEDDPLSNATRHLDEELTALGIEHTYDAFPGKHDWPYWREHLSDTLRFFDSVL